VKLETRRPGVGWRALKSIKRDHGRKYVRIARLAPISGRQRPSWVMLLVGFAGLGYLGLKTARMSNENPPQNLLHRVP
jgi:hypothetical protein